MKLARCDHCPREQDERRMYTTPIGNGKVIRLCSNCYEADQQRMLRETYGDQGTIDYREERR